MAFSLAVWLGAASALAVYHALFAFIVIAVPKSAIFTRFASIMPFSAAAYAVIIHTIGPIGPLQLNTTLLVIFLVHWLSLIEYICMARLDSFKLSELVLRDRASHNGSKTSKTKNGDRIAAVSGTATIGQQVWKALSLTTNFRRLYTEWEVKNVFHRETKQTRLGFVIDVLPKAMLSYLVIDCLMHAPPPEAHLITEAKQTPWRLWTLTSEDVAFRVPGSISLWLVARLVIYIITQGVLGVPSVILGLSSPDYWQPLFGPFSELYTIRGFWGSFWHQCLRRTLTSHANFISDRILCVPRGTLASRYTRITFVFLIFGLVHHPADALSGLPLNQTASLGFFVLQPMGVMIEDAVQALTRDWPIPRIVRTMAGYIWVLFFLFATTPRWMFPAARLNLGPTLLPFSFVAPAIKYYTMGQHTP